MGIVFIHSPDKGFWACLVDLSPGMPKRPEIRLSWSKAASLSSGRIVLRVTIADGNSIHPT